MMGRGGGWECFWQKRKFYRQGFPTSSHHSLALTCLKVSECKDNAAKSVQRAMTLNLLWRVIQRGRSPIWLIAWILQLHAIFSNIGKWYLKSSVPFARDWNQCAHLFVGLPTMYFSFSSVNFQWIDLTWSINSFFAASSSEVCAVPVLYLDVQWVSSYPLSLAYLSPVFTYR
jgi:hypothetical protein